MKFVFFFSFFFLVAVGYSRTKGPAQLFWPQANYISVSVPAACSTHGFRTAVSILCMERRKSLVLAVTSPSLQFNSRPCELNHLSRNPPFIVLSKKSVVMLRNPL